VCIFLYFVTHKNKFYLYPSTPHPHPPHVVPLEKVAPNPLTSPAGGTRIKAEEKKKIKKRHKVFSFFLLVASWGLDCRSGCASFSIVTLPWVLLIPCRVSIVKGLSHNEFWSVKGFLRNWGVAIAWIWGRLTAGQQTSHAWITCLVSGTLLCVGWRRHCNRSWRKPGLVSIDTFSEFLQNCTGPTDWFSWECRWDCAGLRTGLVWWLIPQSML